MSAEGLTLANWITIFIFIGTVGIMFLLSAINRTIDGRHRKRIACYAIIREVDDAESAYNQQSTFPLIQRPENNVSYRNAFLITDSYDSVLYSGVLLEFKPKLQTQLASFYSTIKNRNETIKNFNLHNLTFFIEGITQERLERWRTERLRYEVPITQYEDYIIEHLDIIRSEVKKEIP